MPSSNVYDPTNYTAVLENLNDRWHTGASQITWSTLNSIPTYYQVPGGYEIGGQFYRGFNPSLSPTQQAMAELAVQRFGEVANINFVETQGLGQLTFGTLNTGSSGLYGFAYLPGTDNGGDIWLNNDNGIVRNPTYFDEGWDTFIHELGHAVGLEHSFSGITLPGPLENSLYTVMSYDPIPTQAGVSDPAQQFPITPMLYDIQALQVAYGANMNTRTGNDIYFATGAGSVNGFGIADGGSRIATIWDAGGIDTFDASAQSQRVEIDLRPGQLSTIGGIANNILIALGVPGTRALSAIIENATGGSGADELVGNIYRNDLRGGAGADVLYGRENNDRLYGDGGADVLFGGSGDDLLIGGLGTDQIYGGTGFDTVSYVSSGLGVTLNLAAGIGSGGHASGDRIYQVEHAAGSRASDTLNGSSAPNRLQGMAGNDTLRGYAGGDILEGGAGNDVLVGGAGGDILRGGEGRDTVSFSGATGGVTANLESGGTFGDAAGDRYVSIENMSGSAFGDRLYGSASSNRLAGGEGDDYLYARGGGDILIGGAGNDTLYAGSGREVLNGGSGYDTVNYLYGSPTAGVTVNLEAGLGSAGWATGDRLFGIEHLVGTKNADELTGSQASNRLNGGAGNDVLRGGGSGDVLLGSGGDDILFGGTGGDVFVFSRILGNDTVRDFEDGLDRFDFTTHFDVESFSDLSISNIGDHAVITDPNGATVTVIGAADLLDGSDFIF